jgi:hypothetical protein
VSNLSVYMGAPPFAKRLAHFFHDHEHEIVVGCLILGGLTVVGMMWAFTKAAPLAVKLAMVTPKGIAAHQALARAGIIAI